MLHSQKVDQTNIPKYTSQDSTSYKGFLANLSITHGPGGLLGRMFLAGDRALNARGLSLVFGSFETMATVNEQNFATWGPLVPLFDARHAPIPEDRGFCLFALDRDQSIVACQAARLFDLTGSNLQQEAETGRLFYPDQLPPANEVYSLAVPETAAITGRITYSGGLWVHPTARGLELGSILPRISRAYAQGLWDTTHIVSFARSVLVEKGMIPRYGYPHTAQPFQRQTDGVTDFEGVVVWMSRAEMIADTTSAVERLAAEVNGRVRHGRGGQQTLSV
jgi:hypothetical protein